LGWTKHISSREKCQEKNWTVSTLFDFNFCTKKQKHSDISPIPQEKPAFCRL
jgi:hypothetical protein